MNMSSVFATLVAVICFLGSCSEGVEVPRPNVTKTNNASLCILPSSNEEDRENVTARCTAPRGSVVWLMGDYAMVDRDQFSGDTFGVLIEDSQSNNSSLTLFPEGANFLLERFNNQTFTISCQTVVDEVNTRRTDSSPLTLYGAFSDIEPPEVEVIHCNADGSYTISISYKYFNETCAGEDIEFFLSLSDRTSNCTSDKFEKFDKDFTRQCDVKNTTNLTATLTARAGDYSRDFISYLSVTCNNATWRFCPGDDGKMIIRVFPNFVERTGDWMRQFTNGDGSTDPIVTDVSPDGTLGGQGFPAIYDPNLDCNPGGDNDDNGITSRNLGIAIGVGGGVAIAIILLILLALGICFCCWKKGKRNTDPPKPNTADKVGYHNVENEGKVSVGGGNVGGDGEYNVGGDGEYNVGGDGESNGEGKEL